MTANNDCGDCWIIALDGKPMDIHGTSDLAVRQGKIRKQDNPGSVVTIHYGPASARTEYRDGKLHVDVIATVSDANHIATVSA